MDKAKVCHLTSAHSAFDARIFHKECKSLAAAGLDVHLVAPNDMDRFIDGVKVHAIKEEKNRIKRRTKIIWDVYKSAIKLKAEVYHFHDPELIPIGLYLTWRGARVIYDVHEDYPAAITLRYYIPKILRSFISTGFSSFEKSAARFMAGIVTADEGTAARFEKHSNVIILYNFPMKSLFGNQQIKEAPTQLLQQEAIVHIGGISKAYGVFVLLHMVRILVKDHCKNICLLFVGACHDSGLRESIRNFLKTHQIENNVRITGRVPHQDVFKYVRNARLGLIALQPHAKFKVNIPTKMFEYMACGIPFVGSDLPTISQFAGDFNKPCGLLVDPESSEAFALSVKRLLDNPEYATELGKNGRQHFLSIYNWSTQAEKLINFYGRISRE